MDENQVSDVSTPVVDNANSSQEKLFTRDQLSKIVNAESAKAAQKARLEAEEKYKRDMEEASAARLQQDKRNIDTPRDVDANAIYQQVQERFNQEMQEQRMKDHISQIASSYQDKIDKGRARIENFDEVTKGFDPTAYPQLVYLLAGMDNAADVLVELQQNPLKFAAIDQFSQKDPNRAKGMLEDISNSIRKNQQALADADSQSTPEPLDRLQPSRVSGSNGKMSIRDLKNQPWLRG